MIKNFIIPLYLIFLVILVIFTYLFVDHNLSFLRSLYTGTYWNNRELISASYLLIIVIFFGFYFLFMKNLKSINLKLIIGFTSLILFFSYPAFASYDIFNYMTTSRVLFKYQENPYLITSQEFIGDEYLPFTRATNKTALYGPSWIIASSVPYSLGVGNFVLTLFSFKLISLLSYLGLSFLIFKISQSKLSTALFALNPLVIIETIVSSHNDSFMMLFALASFYLLSRRRFVSSSISLAISILVKFATIFLLPVYGLVFWKTIKKEKINWEKIYLFSALSMFTIFLLSFFREEIYPWYAIWFLTFSSLIPKVRWLLYLSFAFSFGLLLSYLPYMRSGIYDTQTITLKYVFLFSPIAFMILLGITQRLWKRKLHLR